MMKSAIRLFIFSLIVNCSVTFAQNPTKIVFYKPYTQDNVLNPYLVVAQRYKGTCLTRSLANPARPDAWRCQASNLILDPCFQDGDSLACVISPWTHRVALLELNQPFFKRQPTKVNVNQAQPWGLELANGQKCSFLTGASLVVNNIRVNYSCQGYNYSIIGNVDRSSSVWKVNFYDFNKKSIRQVAVVTAWF